MKSSKFINRRQNTTNEFDKFDNKELSVQNYLLKRCLFNISAFQFLSTFLDSYNEPESALTSLESNKPTIFGFS